MNLQIEPIRELPCPGFGGLLGESLAEGYDTLNRMLCNWETGYNRFRREGEGVWGAYVNDRLVGICGRSECSHSGDSTTCRVRHLYVREPFRGRGVGRALVDRALDVPSGRFRRVAVRAVASAKQLFESLGFVPVRGSRMYTHLREFRTDP